MADFNLVPTPRVLLVQVVIFIVNTIIVKKLLINPYLRLQAKRLDYTERKQAAATQRVEALRQELAVLHTQRRRKLSELAQLRRSRYERARAQREEIITTATRSAEADIKAAKTQLRQQFDAAHADLDRSVKSIGQEIFAVLISSEVTSDARR